jgi:Lon protease-like protein
MFPLGSVIFPYSAVPLRVFEPRYLALLETVSSTSGEFASGEFGSVLIERGFEVGGGDQRFGIGTRVRIMGSTDLEDGHKAIVVAGIERIRITEWLADDPHPWAMVETVPDVAERFDVTELIDEAAARLKTVMVLASELGADTSDLDLSVSEDPVAASFQLAALAPVTPLDSYEMLAAASIDERLELAASFLGERIEMIRAELAGGGS